MIGTRKARDLIRWSATSFILIATITVFVGCDFLNPAPEEEAQNSPPVADAGEDQTVQVGATVTLQGSANDSDGDPLTYSWAFASVPDESAAMLSEQGVATPSFTADKSGDYVLRLEVSDGTDVSAPDSVTITASPDPLVAVAGDDQTAVVDDTVTLDGSASSGPEERYYTWEVESPEGSNSFIEDPSSIVTTFVPDVRGIYTITLTVDDGVDASDSDIFTLVVESKYRMSLVGEVVYESVLADGIHSDVSGSYAYVTDSQSGLIVFDVSDPTDPTPVGRTNSAGYADVILEGDYAYVAAAYGGVETIDISVPSAPVSVGSVDWSNWQNDGVVWELAVEGSTLYCAAFADTDKTPGQQGNLIAIDVGIPTSPALLGTYTSNGAMRDVAVSGTTVYAADGTEGVLVLDASDPADITLASQITMGYAPDRIIVDGTELYVVTGAGVEIYDITTPSNPIWSSTIVSSQEPSTAGIDGGPLVVATGSTGGIALYDVSNPASPSPSPLGAASGNDWPFDVTVSGDYAYVTSSISYLIFDISDTSHPALAGRYDADGTATDLAAEGNYLYVADNALGIKVFDITSPSAPVLAKSYRESRSNSLFKKGSHLYSSTGSHLEIFDLSQPANPHRVSTTDVGIESETAGAWSLSVVVDDSDRAFLASHGAGITAVDVSNVLQPSVTGRFDTDGLAVDMAVVGNTAFVADSDNGLVILDVTSPDAISMIGQVPPDPEAFAVAWAVTAVGDFVFFGTPLNVLDATSDLSSPSLVYSDNVSPVIADLISLSGSYAFVCEHFNGIFHVVDISDPSSPEILRTEFTDGNTNTVLEHNGYLYVADGGEGIKVYQINQ